MSNKSPYLQLSEHLIATGWQCRYTAGLPTRPTRTGAAADLGRIETWFSQKRGLLLWIWTDGGVQVYVPVQPDSLELASEMALVDRYREGEQPFDLEAFERGVTATGAAFAQTVDAFISSRVPDPPPDEVILLPAQFRAVARAANAAGLAGFEIDDVEYGLDVEKARRFLGHNTPLPSRLPVRVKLTYRRRP